MYTQETLVTTYVPISVDEMLYHLKVDVADTAEREYVEQLMLAAQDHLCNILDMRMGETNVEIIYDAADLVGFTFIRDLMPYPFISFTGIKLLGADGVTYNDAPASTYLVEKGHDETRIRIIDTLTYVGTYAVAKVQYKVGYTSTNLPPKNLLAAIKMLAGHWYENRTPVMTGTMVNEVPFSVDMVIRSLKKYKAY